MAGLLPVVPAFERAFWIDEDVGDILDVANFPLALPRFQQGIVGSGGPIGRIQQKHPAVPGTKPCGQRPVLALDVVDNSRTWPGEERGHSPTPLPERVGAKHSTCSGPSWRKYVRP